MQRTSRRILILASLAVTAAVGWTVSIALGPRVEGVQPVRRPLTETLLVNGRVTSPGRAELGAMVGGTVAEVPVPEGGVVPAGTTLVRLLDDEPLARLHEAEAQLLEARSRLERLQSVGRPVARQRLQQARLQAEEAATAFEREAGLSEGGWSTQADLDAARFRRDDAASQLVAAELEHAATVQGGADTTEAAAGLARAQASLEAAQAVWANTRVRAPTPGTVLEHRVEVGQIVRAGDALIVFSGEGDLTVEVTPDEVHLGRLEAAQRAVVRVEAFPDRVLEAHVAQLAPQVDPARGTVRVRLDLDATPPDWLRPDMTATVEIVLGQWDDALLLPVTHVQGLAGGGAWVLAVEDGRVARREVVLGAQDAAAVEIREGLDEDDVVLPADAAVHVGDRVRTRPPQPGLPAVEP